MKKIIRKFWGVGLVLILLSTLLVGALPQAAAANYTFSLDTSQPTAVNRILAPTTNFGIRDVAASGSTIYAVGNNLTGGNFLYKSTTGGASWVPCVAALIPNVVGTDNWSIVAVAPDDPNWVVVVNKLPAGDQVYASRDGGASFENLSAVGGASVVINDATISPDVGVRYIAVGGNDAVAGATSGTIDSWTVGPIAPQWANITNGGMTNNNTAALQFTPNFPADRGLVVVNDDSGNATNRNVRAEVYSYNLLQWNPAGYNFPITVVAAAAGNNVTCPRAQIALDDNFYLADIATQIGFVGASILSTGAVQVGGVFRFAPVAMTNILAAATAGPINSVAWDGTNLMAGTLGAAAVWYSASALAPFPVFLPNTAFKAPSTGTDALVLFNGGVGYCFSQGNNSAVARTTTYGASFDGIALINSNFNTVVDFWVSPDASTTYVVTDDGIDINLWKKAGTTWERIMILAGLTGDTWLVRADDVDPEAVYLGKQGDVIIYKSLDGGATWAPRAFAANMQDFVVQDANVLYAADLGLATVRKTDSGGFLWYNPVATGLAIFGNTNYSLNLVADDQLTVGGNAGAVAYSADGNTSWAPIMALIGGGGNVITQASGLATGDVIWAASTSGNITVWWVGLSVVWVPDIASPLGASYTGLAYENNILYAWDEGSNTLARYLYPLTLGVVAQDRVLFLTPTTFTSSINSLKSTTGSTTLWSYDSVIAPEMLYWYTDNLIGSSMAPVPTYPIDDTIIPVNSINGNVAPFNFQWTAPMGGYFFGYTFDIRIYLDAGMTILVAQANGIGPAGVLDGGVSTIATSAIGAAPGWVPAPGTTYYWRVRVAAGTPLESYYSPLQTFSIEQLVAVVPALASPVNGSEISSTSPGFSWSPITGATSYRFELATDTAFTAESMVYTCDPASAGVDLPSTVVPLDRGQQYFWRVKTLTPNEGDWSAVGNFIVAELPPETSPPVTITTAPTPTITAIISQPADTTTVITVPPAEEKVVNPSYIWAIIVVGAVLVIAVIILIVRTRRTV